MFCPSCGKPTEETDQFCQACGARLDEVEIVPPAVDNPPVDPIAPPTPPANKRRKTAVVAASVSLGVILVAAIGFVAGFNYAKSSQASFMGFVFVNEKAFPDEALRSYVSTYVDTNHDGVITPDENAAVTQLDIRQLSETSRNARPLETTANTADATVVAAEAEDDASDTTTGIASLEGIEHLSGLESLICPNAGLTELDLSGNPELEYIDCRGNDFGVLDVSGNKNIECLYCDDDVYITGIDEAGLYCDDLLVSAQTNGKDIIGRKQAAFSYDQYGRLVEGNGKTYLYDADGRLSGVYVAETTQDKYVAPSFTDEYRYGEGNASINVTKNQVRYSDDSEHPLIPYPYQIEALFDDHGRLVADNATVPAVRGPNMQRDRTFTYEGDASAPALVTQKGGKNDSLNVSAYPDSSGTFEFSYNDQGAATSRASSFTFETTDGKVSQTSHQINYAAIDSWLTISASEEGASDSGFPVGESTRYDDRGFPAESINGDVNSPISTTTYECNIDGYITKATWDWSASSQESMRNVGNRTLEMQYVKHVGSAAYKDLLPYLPSYVFTSAQDYDYFDMLWQPSNGLWFASTIVETDPIIKARERAGIIAATVRSGMTFADNTMAEARACWPWRVNVLWTHSAVNIPEEAYQRGSMRASSEPKEVAVQSAVNEYSWDELSLIAEKVRACDTREDAIATAKSYNLINADGSLTGKSIPVTMSDGVVLEIELVGIFHDDKADGSGKAGLTFMTSNAYCNHPMNNAKTNEGGWEASDMRAWLNSTVLDNMPDSIQDLIVPVKKATNNVGRTETSDSVSTTEDRIWLFSQRELFGTITWNQGYPLEYIDTVLNEEGEQYQLFKEAGIEGIATTDKKGILKKYVTQNGKDILSNWWVRSPTPNREDGFGDVDNGEPDNGGNASDAQGVVFGFCL